MELRSHEQAGRIGCDSGDENSPKGGGVRSSRQQLVQSPRSSHPIQAVFRLEIGTRSAVKRSREFLTRIGLTPRSICSVRGRRLALPLLQRLPGRYLHRFLCLSTSLGLCTCPNRQAWRCLGSAARASAGAVASIKVTSAQVIPEKSGIHFFLITMDSRLRGNDGMPLLQSFLNRIRREADQARPARAVSFRWPLSWGLTPASFLKLGRALTFPALRPST